ncbi:inner membrane-spanning protein YciB [Thetidibacter halocola]|uniref:Inner membrane-spanning protein YciB n=1 Tax=Thetidibacter halocola TaxID=2827239 RepID=A0A8J8B8D6_9RHOB|nr:inner membrane-spanning protein YciB [Thetidibacter halocola]MBS0126106.1 septation protein IspZ [Thetidibacter halocola]
MTEPSVETRKVNPTLKSLLELGPVIGFLVAYFWFKDDVFTVGGQEYGAFIAVTGIFVPVFLLSMGILWWMTGVISRMQVFTGVLLVVMGGLTVWFNDDRFVKLKPTLIYGAFGAILGFGLLFGRSYLRYVMEELMPLQPEGWMLLTQRATMFFFGMALANVAIWQLLSEQIFVLWDTVGQIGATFAFFMGQVGLFSRYGIDKDDETPAE